MEFYADSEIDPVFRAVTRRWLEKIESAKTHKREVFGAAADEALQFYQGPKNWDELMGGPSILGQGTTLDGPQTTFKMSVNKTFEFVTIFGPALYYENPVRTVRPRMPVLIPQAFYGNPLEYQAVVQQENLRIMIDGLKSLELEAYLNWSPNEFGLSEESRLAIDEALIKGRGVVWQELYTPPGATWRTVRSVWDSVDHLFTDPDAHSFKASKWIAQQCIHPVWEVEKKYGLRRDSLKGNMESHDKQSEVMFSDAAQYDRKRGFSNDLLKYYKIYSKMGVGGRLQGMLRDYRGPLEVFGDYCYLVVCENCPFPLNLSPDVTNNPEFSANPRIVFEKAAWPTPYWGNESWPCEVLDFHAVHNCPWPMPHLKAGIGELKFLNWAMSFLAGKLRTTTRDFIAVKKSLSEDIKTAILSGKDLEILEMEEDHGLVTDLIQFLQHPQVNGDIWKFVDAIEDSFDKRVGLNELMYGNSGATQPRSAQEVNIKSQNMNVRPDDMAKQVEAWQARVAAKEAVTCRYHLVSMDVQPIFGDSFATAWDQYVHTQDISEACRQLDYRIEAGSTRRPNKDFQVRQMTEGFQALSPVLQAYSQATGDVGPLNNLLQDFAKSRDLDPNRYQLTAPIPPPTPTAAQIAVGSSGANTQNISPPG